MKKKYVFGVESYDKELYDDILANMLSADYTDDDYDEYDVDESDPQESWKNFCSLLVYAVSKRFTIEKGQDIRISVVPGDYILGVCFYLGDSYSSDCRKRLVTVIGTVIQVLIDTGNAELVEWLEVVGGTFKGKRVIFVENIDDIDVIYITPDCGLENSSLKIPYIPSEVMDKSNKVFKKSLQKMYDFIDNDTDYIGVR